MDANLSPQKIAARYDQVSKFEGLKWDVDCSALSDFDKGVIGSLWSRSLVRNPQWIKPFLSFYSNPWRLLGLLLAVWWSVRKRTFGRYRALYSSAKSRRDFRYDQIVPIVSGCETFLDVGCGQAPYFRELSKVVTYKGVDLSQGMIEACTKKYGNHFQLASATELPFGNKKFDVVCAFGVLMFYDDPEQFIIEMIRVGKLYIAFDVLDDSRLPYQSPWLLNDYAKYFLGMRRQPYTCDVRGIENMMQANGYRRHLSHHFVDGLSQSTLVLVYKRIDRLR